MHLQYYYYNVLRKNRIFPAAPKKNGTGLQVTLLTSLPFQLYWNLGDKSRPPNTLTTINEVFLIWFSRKLSMVSTRHCSLSVPQDALGGHSSMNGWPKPDHPVAPPVVVAVALFAVIATADAATSKWQRGCGKNWRTGEVPPLTPLVLVLLLAAPAICHSPTIPLLLRCYCCYWVKNY